MLSLAARRTPLRRRNGCPSRLPCLTGSFKRTADTHLRLCL